MSVSFDLLVKEKARDGSSWARSPISNLQVLVLNGKGYSQLSASAVRGVGGFPGVAARFRHAKVVES